MTENQLGFVWYLAFLFSTVCHEFAHAFAALKMGDSTAYESGQATLNPVPHIKRSPIGIVVVPLISFVLGGWMIGWASTPYNYEWAYRYPKRSALMSAAGPLANLILLLISAVLIHTGIYFDVFYAPESINLSSIVGATRPGIFEFFATLISIFFSMNLILLIFNLIPVPPLDGSGILLLYMGEERGRKYMDFIRKSAFSMLGIFLAWKLFDIIYPKIEVAFINILYYGSNYQ